MKRRDNDARKKEWQQQWKQLSREFIFFCIGTWKTTFHVFFLLSHSSMLASENDNPTDANVFSHCNPSHTHVQAA